MIKMFKSIENVIILTDMDGTFLPSTKIASQGNLEAVKRFQQAGGRFSIATGRALQASQIYFDTIPVNFPAVLCNGGLVYDIKARQDLMNVYLPESAFNITKRILDDNQDIGCEIILLNELYVPQMNEKEREHNIICKITPVLAPIEDTPKNWYKVLFADEEERINRLEQYVAQQNFCGVDFVRSSEHYLEILPKNISKGSAVSFLKEKFGGEKCQVVCVGDYYNDLEMLKTADIAVCPSNAVDEVKNVCDIVLDKSCDQDAIAELINIILCKSQAL